MTRIDPKTRERIERVVKRVERWPTGMAGHSGVNSNAGGTHQVLLIAQADIEHGAVGNCKIATGTAATAFTAHAADAARSVYNLREKIWSGSKLLAAWTSWRQEGSTLETVWVATHAWSATRIRGVAAAEIAPGTTGTISSVVPLNGHFAPTTLVASLSTAHVTVKAGMVCWAQLAFNGSSSYWDIFSADCDGEA